VVVEVPVAVVHGDHHADPVVATKRTIERARAPPSRQIRHLALERRGRVVDLAVALPHAVIQEHDQVAWTGSTAHAEGKDRALNGLASQRANAHGPWPPGTGTALERRSTRRREPPRPPGARLRA